MTKKSAARLARDAAAKSGAAGFSRDDLNKALDELAVPQNNPCWDQLGEMAHQCQNLLRQHVVVAAQTGNPELLERVEDKEMLATNIRQLSRDLNRLNEKVVQIKGQHADRTGNAVDGDDLMASFSLQNQYMEVMDYHEGVILPTALHIQEQLGQAEARLKTEDAQAHERLREKTEFALHAIRNPNASVKNMTEEQDPSIVTDVVVR